MNCNVETMAEPARIYISYSSDDLPFVRAVADELRTHGVDAWFDESHIASGDHWQHAQEDALRSANVVAIFIGKKTQTPWMNFEIGAAVGGEKRVVPIYLSRPKRGYRPCLRSSWRSTLTHSSQRRSPIRSPKWLATQPSLCTPPAARTG